MNANVQSKKTHTHTVETYVCLRRATHTRAHPTHPHTHTHLHYSVKL